MVRETGIQKHSTWSPGSSRPFRTNKVLHTALLLKLRYTQNEYIDYFMESASYRFLFTNCKTLEKERVSAANEFTKVLQRVNKYPYETLSMRGFNLFIVSNENTAVVHFL